MRPITFGILVAVTFVPPVMLRAADALPASQPNIVILLADDLGYGDLGCYGHPDIQTPHLDRLAQQGVRFTQFYANGPECTPTRTALLTGRYQQRVGGMECAIGTGNVGRYDDAIRLASQHDLGLPTSEMTLARLLKDAGYATALIGKWHLGYEDKFAPNRHGFDHAFYCVGGGMDYFHHVEDAPNHAPVLRLNGQPETRDGYFTDLIAEDAIRWLNRHASNHTTPFFLYLPFTAPHAPYQGPEDKQSQPLAADSALWKQNKTDPRVYAAMIQRMDDAIGQILTTIQTIGQSERTLIIFTSDNGGTKNARTAGLRGNKGSTFEGGIRVPAIVRWPGVLKEASTYPHPALTFDLTASLIRATGAAIPTRMKLDGVDILRLVADSQPPPQRDLFWRQRRGDVTWHAVREGPLKLVRETRGQQIKENLFNVETDPTEQGDLSPTHAAEVQRLKAKLAAWEQAVKPAR